MVCPKTGTAVLKWLKRAVTSAWHGTLNNQGSPELSRAHQLFKKKSVSILGGRLVLIAGRHQIALERGYERFGDESSNTGLFRWALKPGTPQQVHPVAFWRENTTIKLLCQHYIPGTSKRWVVAFHKYGVIVEDNGLRGRDEELLRSVFSSSTVGCPLAL